MPPAAVPKPEKTDSDGPSMAQFDEIAIVRLKPGFEEQDMFKVPANPFLNKEASPISKPVAYIGFVEKETEDGILVRMTSRETNRITFKVFVHHYKIDTISTFGLHHV